MEVLVTKYTGVVLYIHKVQGYVVMNREKYGHIPKKGAQCRNLELRESPWKDRGPP